MDASSALRLRGHKSARRGVAVAFICLMLGLIAPLAAPAVAGAAGAPDWVKRLAGDGRANAAFGAIIVNDRGAVYAVGSAELGRISGRDATIAKYAPNGDRRWLRHWTSKGKVYDAFESVALDPSGNVYAAGRGSATVSSPWGRLVIAKYAADGRRRWARTYGSDGRVVSTTPIAVDRFGNSYVCVTVAGTDSTAWVTLKYGAGGRLLWRKTWFPPSAGQPRVFPSDLAIDPAGNVYETGSLYTWNGASGLRECATVKYSSAGTRRWIRRFAFGTDDENFGIAICCAAGHAYVAGQSGMESGSGDLHAFALSYAAGGALAWSGSWASPGASFAWFLDIVADASGNAYACGAVDDGAGATDAVVACFGPTGSVTWATPVDIGDDDEFVAIARSSPAALVTTGTADNAIALTGVLSATGAIDFSVAWIGQAGEIDQGLAVAASAGGEVYVAGRAKPPAKHWQGLLLKY